MKKRSIFSWLGFNKKPKPEEQPRILTPILSFSPRGIRHIEQAPDGHYFKVIYGMGKGSDLTRLPVANKKGKNYPLIFNEFMSTLKMHLEVDGKKVLAPPKPRLSIWHFCLFLAFTLLASAVSLQFLLNTVWTGLFFSSVSIFSLYLVLETRAKDILDNKSFGKDVRAYHGLLEYYQANKNRVPGLSELQVITNADVKEKGASIELTQKATATMKQPKITKTSRVIAFKPKREVVKAEESKMGNISSMIGKQDVATKRNIYKANVIQFESPVETDALASSMQTNPNYTTYTPIAPIDRKLEQGHTPNRTPNRVRKLVRKREEDPENTSKAA